ncbi:P-loop NTPase family protein [Leptothoe spongobia]|uniref:Mobilization protein n=1 Tax=Leptothoe spongobia TAU-MAC 1115 TaxID=1967444 RepID=A0A947DMD1_9CYAN|nr:hypothetical protein [Leptothoe spongobia]MBT9317721.1 hypothetical protein [Leptothoe spongobia TAU-MAC 1115]
MADIHLFGGEKGGVGKSFVCRTAIAYHLDREIDFVPFDSDRSNADVLRIYGQPAGCRQAIFSEAERYDDAANGIFNAALEGHRVLVNLPAQAMPALTQWINDNELLELANETEVSFVSWFVSDCGLDSLKLFGEMLDTFGDRVQHVFVANYGMTERWERLKDNQALMDRMREAGVKLVKFPKFVGRAVRDKIDERSLTFEAAKASDELDPIGRQGVKSFLRKSFEQFEAAGVFANGQ